MRRVPDDVVIVFSGIFAAVLFAWTQQGNVYGFLDFMVYILVIGCLFVCPLLYAMYFRCLVDCVNLLGLLFKPFTFITFT